MGVGVKGVVIKGIVRKCLGEECAVGCGGWIVGWWG